MTDPSRLAKIEREIHGAGGTDLGLRGRVHDVEHALARVVSVVDELVTDCDELTSRVRETERRGALPVNSRSGVHPMPKPTTESSTPRLIVVIDKLTEPQRLAKFAIIGAMLTVFAGSALYMARTGETTASLDRLNPLADEAPAVVVVEEEKPPDERTLPELTPEEKAALLYEILGVVESVDGGP